MGAERGGPCRRTRRELTDRIGAAGAVGVEREAGVVVAAGRLQRVEHPAVHLDAAVWGQLGIDGHACQLVAEAHGVAIGDEQPGVDQLVDVEAVEPGRGEERRLHPAAQQGHHVECRPRRRADPQGPGQHGVACRAGQVGRAGGQQFGQEEGVAAGQAVERPGIETGRSGEFAHAVQRQRVHVEPLRRLLPRQLADRLAPRAVAGDHVVAERQDDEAPQATNAAGDEAQEVQRRLVGPVHVLDEEHRQMWAVEEVEQRGELLGARGAGATGRGERATDLRGDVEHRTQRTGRELAVACPDEPLGVGELELQRVDERRLADAGLTGDEHQPTRPGPGRGRRIEQRLPRLLPLDEPHGVSLPLETAATPDIHTRPAHARCRSSGVPDGCAGGQ